MSRCCARRGRDSGELSHSLGVVLAGLFEHLPAGVGVWQDAEKVTRLPTRGRSEHFRPSRSRRSHKQTSGVQQEEESAQQKMENGKSLLRRSSTALKVPYYIY